MKDAGLTNSDVCHVALALEKNQEIFAEVSEPRLLHGDLWTANVMVETDNAEPIISGVFDNDRTLWGDPEADWPIFMAAKKPGTERDAFWQAYGPRLVTPDAMRRSLFYHAIPGTYAQMKTILEKLDTGID